MISFVENFAFSTPTMAAQKPPKSIPQMIIAAILLDYLIFNSSSYWRDPKSFGFPTGKRLVEAAYWYDMSFGPIKVPFGFLVAMIAAGIVWFLYNRTRFVYEVSVIASSPSAARYAGIRTRWKIITVMSLSGALAGLGGASDVGDFRHVLDAIASQNFPCYCCKQNQTLQGAH